MSSERTTRGRPSKVKRLPEEIRAQLHMMLRDGGMTQQQILEDINAIIDESGLPDSLRLTRSGLNRYASHMESAGQEMREIREVTSAWVAQFGERPTGEVGKLLVEMLRTQSFRLLMKFQTDPDLVMDADQVGDLALAIQRLERAQMLSYEHEKELRKEYAAKVAEAAEAAGKRLASEGMSRDTVEAIKKQILGIA